MDEASEEKNKDTRGGKGTVVEMKDRSVYLTIIYLKRVVCKS